MRVSAALLAATMLAVPDVAPGQTVPVRHAVEEFRIAAADHDMTDISFVAISRRGVIAVGQPDDEKVLFFQPDGRMTSFGRSGGGPGEFKQLARLDWVGDTVWVMDMSLRRITYIGPGGELLRTIPFPAATDIAAASTVPHTTIFSMVLPLRAYANGDLLITPFTAENSPRPSWTPEEHARDTPLMRWHPQHGFRAIIGWNIATPEPNPCFARQTSGKNGFSIAIPFCPLPASAVSPSGLVSVNVLPDTDDPSGGPFTVIVTDGQGKTRYSRSYPAAQLRVSTEDVQKTRTRFDNVPNAPPAMREAMKTAKIPEWYPPFTTTLVGDEGWVWIEHFGADGQRAWQVLDPRGRAAYTLTLPRSVRLQVVSQATVWGVETDDDGLQDVVRYGVK